MQLTTRALVSSSVLAVLLVLVLTPLTEAGIMLDKYCENRCSHGRGGELCQCSASHFVGKRVRENENVRPSLDDDTSHHFAAAKSGVQSASGSDDMDIRLRHIGRSHRSNYGSNTDVDGFNGDESPERSAVEKLASLLKATIENRVAKTEESRLWKDDLPLEEDMAPLY